MTATWSSAANPAGRSRAIPIAPYDSGSDREADTNASMSRTDGRVSRNMGSPRVSGGDCRRDHPFDERALRVRVGLTRLPRIAGQFAGQLPFQRLVLAPRVGMLAQVIAEGERPPLFVAASLDE